MLLLGAQPPPSILPLVTTLLRGHAVSDAPHLGGPVRSTALSSGADGAFAPGLAGDGPGGESKPPGSDRSQFPCGKYWCIHRKVNSLALTTNPGAFFLLLGN